MQILLDADALVALAKSDDGNHARARGIHSNLKRAGVDFVVSQFTIPEAATVLSYKVSQQAGKNFLEAARLADFDELELTEELSKMADAWFLKSNKKGTSYFDCVNLALLAHYELDAIFSFDEVYRKNGFHSASEL